MTPVGDTPQVADITTLEDTQSGAIVINRNAGDGSEVTHFKVSGITNGALYKNDGTTAISDGSYITFAEAQAGLKFTPDADSTSAGSFDVQSSEDGTTVAAQSGVATSTITVTPVGDTPQVADITTDEDTQSGLIVIDRNAGDGAEVTHLPDHRDHATALCSRPTGRPPSANGELHHLRPRPRQGLKFTPDGELQRRGQLRRRELRERDHRSSAERWGGDLDDHGDSGR